MNTTQESKVACPSSSADGHQRFCFRSKKAYRHGQLRRRLGSVSQRMLTRTLRNLDPGLIAACDEIETIAVEYSLTHLGRPSSLTWRHVPLGKTLPQERERRSATSRNETG